MAALNAGDRRHGECTSLLTSLNGRRLLPSPVLTEVSWLLERWPKVEAAFLAQVAQGTFELVHPDTRRPDAHERTGPAVRRFPPRSGRRVRRRVAERFDVRQVATLDQRHFNVIRPTHATALTLLP